MHPALTSKTMWMSWPETRQPIKASMLLYRYHGLLWSLRTMPKHGITNYAGYADAKYRTRSMQRSCVWRRWVLRMENRDPTWWNNTQHLCGRQIHKPWRNQKGWSTCQKSHIAVGMMDLYTGIVAAGTLRERVLDYDLDIDSSIRIG